ncbi:MAG: energy-coupling factor transporter transmembrane protein EcfT [Desulfobacterales bacterium]|nr:MAG: energy-coupling factor transporter transmembrane protein EcfT [Desulfobacterales bacterium]
MLDPRTKLVLALFYAILIVASQATAWLAAELGVLLLIVLIMQKGRAYLRWLRMLLPMALFFGAVVWWSIDWPAAVDAAMKLITLTSTFFVFFSATTPDEMGDSLVKVRLPYTVAFVFSTALQFVPVVGRKAKNVFDAQRARGIPVEPGWSSLRNYPAFLTPLLIQAFKLAEELAEAMEARGFGRPHRSFLKEYKLRTVDWLALAGGLLVLAAVLFLQGTN